MDQNGPFPHSLIHEIEEKEGKKEMKTKKESKNKKVTNQQKERERRFQVLYISSREWVLLTPFGRGENNLSPWEQSE